MKSILQSIKPQYCELIASVKKTIEVRKTRPKCELPVKVYIYCTKDGFYGLQSKTNPALKKNASGKVIGEYVCDEIIELECKPIPFAEEHYYYDMMFDDEEQTCLTQEQLLEYGKGKTLYGWHISDLVIYDKPKELSEFVKCNMPSFDDLDGSDVLCDYCTMTDFGERKSFGFAAGNYYDCGENECREAYKSYIEDNQYLTRPPQSWCYVEEVIE